MNMRPWRILTIVILDQTTMADRMFMRMVMVIIIKIYIIMIIFTMGTVCARRYLRVLILRMRQVGHPGTDNNLILYSNTIDFFP